MAADVYAYVAQFATCHGPRPAQKDQRWMQLFPPRGPLKSVVINIFGQIKKTGPDNRFIVAMKERYSKLTRVLPYGK